MRSGCQATIRAYDSFAERLRQGSVSGGETASGPTDWPRASSRARKGPFRARFSGDAWLVLPGQDAPPPASQPPQAPLASTAITSTSIDLAEPKSTTENACRCKLR
jgi:hypothetical protein